MNRAQYNLELRRRLVAESGVQATRSILEIGYKCVAARDTSLQIFPIRLLEMSPHLSIPRHYLTANAPVPGP
jgi:hypothetical protein